MSGSDDGHPAPTPRADSARNRARLLSAARRVLAWDDTATLQSIAREAQVGQGTLYRHFPTRETLLAAIYRSDFETLIFAAESLRASEAPDVALRRWLDELAVFGREKRLLASVLDAATRAELHDEQYDRILHAIDEILDAGARAGTFRRDVAAPDVLSLVAFLWQAGPTDTERTRRLLDVVLGGIRECRQGAAGAAGPQPRRDG